MPLDPFPPAKTQLTDVVLREVHFRRNLAFDFDKPAPPYSVDARAEAIVADDREHVSADLVCRIIFHPVPDSEQTEDPFDLELVLTGIFHWDVSDVADEEIDGWVSFNAVHLLWPYLRMHVSQITMAAGIPPLFIYTMRVPQVRAGRGLREAAEPLAADTEATEQ